MLVKYADLLVIQLKAVVQKNPVQDMSARYNCTTFDFMGDFAFGEAFSTVSTAAASITFSSRLSLSFVLGFQMQQIEWYGLLSLVRPLISDSVMKPKEDMDWYTEELVYRRFKRGYVPGKTDVFNYLLSNKKEEDLLSPAGAVRKVENGITLVAGSETTATLLTGSTYFCARTPRN
jgi:cytochrome P450